MVTIKYLAALKYTSVRDRVKKLWHTHILMCYLTAVNELQVLTSTQIALKTEYFKQYGSVHHIELETSVLVTAKCISYVYMWSEK